LDAFFYFPSTSNYSFFMVGGWLSNTDLRGGAIGAAYVVLKDYIL
jgi:hypothetical protein